jgi:hypothetical protein
MTTSINIPSLKKKSFTPFLLFLMVCLCSFFISANSDWSNWGDTGRIASAGLEGTFFGSNYPQGSLPFTSNKSFSAANSWTPLVEDYNNDGKNSILLFLTSSVQLYDDKGDYIDTLSLNGSICGNPVNIVNTQNYLTYAVVVTNPSAGQYVFNVINVTDTLQLSFSDNYTTLKTYTCNLAGGYPLTAPDNIVGTVATDNTMLFYEPFKTSSIYDKFYLGVSAPAGLSGKQPRNVTGFFGGSFTAANDNTGDLIIGWVSSAAAANTMALYNYQDDTYITGDLTASGSLNHTSAVANIGSPNSELEFIDHAFTTASNGQYLEVLDDAGTKKLTVNFLSDDKSSFAVADINHDGNNELCYLGANKIFICYDYNYAIIIKSNLTLYTGDCTSYIAIAEYNNSNANSELICTDGIYQIESSLTANATKLLDLGTGGKYGMFLPVTIQQLSSYTKDLIFVSRTEAIYFMASGTAAVCGNSVCESGETVYNCFADCGVNATATNTTIGSIPSGGQCLEDSWCASGICTAGVCSGLPAGSACTNDNQCASGDCTVNNICGLSDNTQILSSLAEMLGFRSVASKIMLSLIIILACTAGTAGLLYTLAPHGGTAIIGAVLGLVIGLILDVVVFGWLGVFFLFGFFFLIVMLIIGYKLIVGSGG